MGMDGMHAHLVNDKDLVSIDYRAQAVRNQDHLQQGEDDQIKDGQ